MINKTETSPQYFSTEPPDVCIAAVQWKNTGGLKQKHKKQPFGDASASHLSLVLWHV